MPLSYEYSDEFKHEFVARTKGNPDNLYHMDNLVPGAEHVLKAVLDMAFDSKANQFSKDWKEMFKRKSRRDALIKYARANCPLDQQKKLGRFIFTHS